MAIVIAAETLSLSHVSSALSARSLERRARLSQGTTDKHHISSPGVVGIGAFVRSKELMTEMPLCCWCCRNRECKPCTKHLVFDVNDSVSSHNGRRNREEFNGALFCQEMIEKEKWFDYAWGGKGILGDGKVGSGRAANGNVYAGIGLGCVGDEQRWVEHTLSLPSPAKGPSTSSRTVGDPLSIYVVTHNVWSVPHYSLTAGLDSEPT